MENHMPAGEIFRIQDRYPSVPGCTISAKVTDEETLPVIHFSLAPHTEISREIYQSKKLWIIAGGRGRATVAGNPDVTLSEGDIYSVPTNVPAGVAADDAQLIYTEVIFGEETTMNEMLKSGEVFALKDLLPFQEGRVVNMDLVHNEKGKLALMSFAAGTGLPEHAAPGDALLFGLEGEGIIGYEGKEYTLHAGENFRFDRGGRHYVKALSNFKMALLLTV